MSEYNRKPWEEYPEYWKTEAEFWSYLRGALRRGIWEKSPIKIDYKNKACTRPPADYTGRAKTGAYCALTGEWVGKSKLQVDHCEGHVSLLSWEDVIGFIHHMIPEKGTLQLVDPEAHKVKSYAEKMGISFEDALLTKSVIAMEKDKTLKQWLEDRGVVCKATERREKALEILKGEKND